MTELQVTGKPTPLVTWSHDGTPMKEGKEVTIYQDTDGLCKLAISEVFPENAGLYSCTAVNPVGEAVAAATLAVEGKRDFNLLNRYGERIAFVFADALQREDL
jgi:Immunoglobulin I-set domain.